MTTPEEREPGAGRATPAEPGNAAAISDGSGISTSGDTGSDASSGGIGGDGTSSGSGGDTGSASSSDGSANSHSGDGSPGSSSGSSSDGSSGSSASSSDGTSSLLELAIPDLVARQAAAAPHRLALRFRDGDLTYRELHERAVALAGELRRRGVRPGDVVAVLAEPSTRFVSVLLGVLCSGAAYLAVSPTDPPERVRTIVGDSGAVLLLASERFAEVAPCVPFEELFGAAAGAEAAAPPLPPVRGADLAYVAYTSGSSGTPKGVMVPHRAVTHLVVDADYVRLGPDDVVASASNAGFDAATFEIWGALLTGAVLYEVEPDVLLSPYQLERTLLAGGVTVMFVTTAVSHLHARRNPGVFGTLRCLLTGGEMMDPALMRAVLDAKPPARILHMYGPTEATTFSTAHPVEAVPPDAASVPIGTGIAHREVHLVDGEICVGGAGVAWGYRGDPRQTAAVFVPDPSRPGARMYRTGDRAQWTAEGTLDITGRLDNQVKIRGIRIELDEVETTIRKVPGVRDAAVVVAGTGEARGLTAFVVADARAEADAEPVDSTELRTRLRALLPPQMIPAVFVFLDALPLSATGKVDRRQLRDAAARQAGS